MRETSPLVTCHSPIEILVVQLPCMWRLGKVVRGRLAKALHVDRKVFQHFVLRHKAPEHFAFHDALRR